MLAVFLLNIVAWWIPSFSALSPVSSLPCFDAAASLSVVFQPIGRTPAMVAQGTRASCFGDGLSYALFSAACQFGFGRRPRSAKRHRRDCILSNEGNNVRVSRSSCVEWSGARGPAFMVRGRRPIRVLELRPRKTDAVRELSIHHPALLCTSQTHVCADTGAAHAQRGTP